MNNTFAGLISRIALTGLIAFASTAPAIAGTFVYVSNADDGDIDLRHAS